MLLLLLPPPSVWPRRTNCGSHRNSKTASCVPTRSRALFTPKGSATPTPPPPPPLSAPAAVAMVVWRWGCDDVTVLPFRRTETAVEPPADAALGVAVGLRDGLFGCCCCVPLFETDPFPLLPLPPVATTKSRVEPYLDKSSKTSGADGYSAASSLALVMGPRAAATRSAKASASSSSTAASSSFATPRLVDAFGNIMCAPRPAMVATFPTRTFMCRRLMLPSSSTTTSVSLRPIV